MVASSFEDVLLVNPTQLQPAASERVSAAESELRVRMPSGYAAYVRQLGAGALGHFVRVFPPQQVPSRTLEWRERVQRYWFWDTVDAGVEAEALQQRGVVLADSFDGDELCFDPGDPETLFVLPRDEDVAHRLGPGFFAAVEWMLSGQLNPWVEGWTFEAGAKRAEVSRVIPGRQLGETASAIEELGEHTHLVDLGHRRTFFLPSIEGRLSLYQLPGQDASLDMTYDEAAPAEAVERFLAVIMHDPEAG
jgi:hypothetical protein